MSDKRIKPILFDIEADGLLDTITKVHCIVAKNLVTGVTARFYNPHNDIVKQRNDYIMAHVRPSFLNATHFIGHNIIGYDDEVLSRFFKLGDKIKETTIIDTLVWSQTLNPDRQLPKGCPTSYKTPYGTQKVTPHSVEAWGYRIGRHKPHYYEWTTFTPEMLYRCEEDVGIQEQIFYELLKEANLSFEDVINDQNLHL